MIKSIPIGAAQGIAKKYDYDQVIIIARKTGDGGGEHVTTYGKNAEHCDIAARIGDFLKFKVMGWKKEGEPDLYWKYEGQTGFYHIMLNGKSVFATKETNQRDMFMAELKLKNSKPTGGTNG